jgi:hypothetical protein
MLCSDLSVYLFAIAPVSSVSYIAIPHVSSVNSIAILSIRY